MRTFNVLVHAPFVSVAAITCVTFCFQNLVTGTPIMLPNSTRRHCNVPHKLSDFNMVYHNAYSIHQHSGEMFWYQEIGINIKHRHQQTFSSEERADPQKTHSSAPCNDSDKKLDCFGALQAERGRHIKLHIEMQ